MRDRMTEVGCEIGPIASALCERRGWMAVSIGERNTYLSLREVAREIWTRG